MLTLLKKTIPAAIVVVLLAACSSDYGPKQTGGTVLGGTGGQSEQAYGTACRLPDGSWKVVK